MYLTTKVMHLPQEEDDDDIDVKAPRGIFLEGILEDILPTLTEELKEDEEDGERGKRGEE